MFIVVRYLNVGLANSFDFDFKIFYFIRIFKLPERGTIQTL